MMRRLLAAVSLVALFAARVGAQCGTTIACGETKNGILSTPSEVDCFSFTVGMGEAVVITTHATAGVFQPCWQLEGTPDVFCGSGERFLASAGTYTIDVFDSGFNQTGAYDINLVVVSDTPSNCAAAHTCG